MTNIEQKRIEAICKVAHIDDISDLSDGYHTFKQLYYQRMMLFAVIVKQNRDKAWKSLRHEDGELCFGGGWFIVGIDTPKGGYTYHYEDNYFSLFDCIELERGKPWDGHTEKDVIRLLSLEQQPCGDAISRQIISDYVRSHIQEINTGYGDLNKHTNEILRMIIDYIESMPPVKPQEPKTVLYSGDGYADGYMVYDMAECPNCGYEYEDGDKDWGLSFCPNCGQELNWESEE